jgi:sulfate permease, SulP family
MNDTTNWVGRVTGRLSLERVPDFGQIKQEGRERAQGFVTGLRERRRAQWRGDFFGGTVAALIAVPYGMALAVAIGLRPEAGLYTSIICGVVYGLLANSPVLISGLSATVVPVLGAVVHEHGVGAALATGFLCGLMMVLLGVLRLGRFVNYLPQPVVSGFTSGLGVIILTSQLKSLLGVKPPPAHFNLGVVDDVWAVAVAANQVNPAALVVAGIVIVTMALLPKWSEHAPASLVGVSLASLVAWFGGLSLPRVGALPSSFPPPSLSGLDFSALPELLTPAMTLAGLCTVNQLLTAVVADRVSDLRSSKQFNRELVAQGVANMVCPTFGAPPGVAMLARTVASTRAGALSRWSVIAHSVVLVLFLLPLSGLVSQIPLTALSTVTVVVGWQLADWRRFRLLGRMSRTDALLFAVTFTLVVLGDLMVGVGAGFLLAMVLFVERSAAATQLVPDARREEASASSALTELVPLPEEMKNEVQCFRLVGPLFFASSGKLFTQLRREATARRLILDFENAGPFDSAAGEFLRSLVELQRRRGGELYLIGLDRPLYAALEKDGLIAELGASRVRLKPPGAVDEARG